MSAVSHEEFIFKLKSGRGEKRESQTQSNLTPDFEGSVWNVRYAQLSIRKLPINKRYGLDGGRKPQNISELSQVGCAAGTWCMEQPFQRALCPWGNLEVSFSTHALQLGVKTIGQDNLYQPWIAQPLFSKGIETLLSSALFHLPICSQFLEMEESALVL